MIKQEDFEQFRQLIMSQSIVPTKILMSPEDWEEFKRSETLRLWGKMYKKILNSLLPVEVTQVSEKTFNIKTFDWHGCLNFLITPEGIEEKGYEKKIRKPDKKV